jgi:hypothetical protein
MVTRKHDGSAYHKLDIYSRLQLVALAKENGQAVRGGADEKGHEPEHGVSLTDGNPLGPGLEGTPMTGQPRRLRLTGGEHSSKFRQPEETKTTIARLEVAVTLVGALTMLALALMESTAGATPIVNHFHFTMNETFTDNRCGIDVTVADSFMLNEQDFADRQKLEVKDTQLMTSMATGKSVKQLSAEQQTNFLQPIDNGDGTTSLVFGFKGLEQKLQLPNGRMLGRDAGPITFTLTFDADGNLISFVSSDEKGPHPINDGGSFGCDVLVPALT